MKPKEFEYFMQTAILVALPPRSREEGYINYKDAYMKKAMLAMFAVLLTLSFTACGRKGPAIGDGMNVKLNYKGTLADGSVFDSSEGKDPLEFTYGAQQIIPALETSLKGLKAGDKKTVTITAKDAYGEYDKEMVFEFPKDQLPPDLTNVEVGTQLYIQSPQGPMPVKISEVKDSTVMIDFNHPLAGKELTFAVEIIEVTKAAAEASSGAGTADAGESAEAAPTETVPAETPAETPAQ